MELCKDLDHTIPRFRVELWQCGSQACENCHFWLAPSMATSVIVIIKLYAQTFLQNAAHAYSPSPNTKFSNSTPSRSRVDQWIQLEAGRGTSCWFHILPCPSLSKWIETDVRRWIFSWEDARLFIRAFITIQLFTMTRNQQINILGWGELTPPP